MKEKYDFISQDRRIIERNLRRHRMSLVEYQKYLKGLQDEGARAEEQLVFREKEGSLETGDEKSDRLKVLP